MLGGRCPHDSEGDFGDPLGYYTCKECPRFQECFPSLAQGGSNDGSQTEV